MVAAFLSGVDEANRRSGLANNVFADEMVVNDDLRLLEAPQSLDRDQPGISRPRPDDVNLACFFHL